MTDTATVETLTAEVRVLMVGNKQITQSVAKQLDHVRLMELQVFGRIKVSGTENLVIGVHRQTGILSVADYQRHLTPSLPFVDMEESQVPDEEMPIVCSAERAVDGTFRLSLDGQSFDLMAGSVRRCGIKEHRGYRSDPRCESWNPAGGLGYIREEIALELKRTRDFVQRNREAAESPLIVLAGLR